MFEGIKFWLSRRLPLYGTFVGYVEDNGGTIVPLETQADMCIIDPLRKAMQYPPKSYSYTFVEMSVRRGELENPDDHLVKSVASTTRQAGNTSGSAKLTRTPFTEADDAFLLSFLRNHPSLEPLGAIVYKQMADDNPRHTWQSWQSRYVKNLRYSHPTPQVAPPTPPTDSSVDLQRNRVIGDPAPRSKPESARGNQSPQKIKQNGHLTQGPADGAQVQKTVAPRQSANVARNQTDTMNSACEPAEEASRSNSFTRQSTDTNTRLPKRDSNRNDLDQGTRYRTSSPGTIVMKPAGVAETLKDSLALLKRMPSASKKQPPQNQQRSRLSYNNEDNRPIIEKQETAISQPTRVPSVKPQALTRQRTNNSHVNFGPQQDKKSKISREPNLISSGANSHISRSQFDIPPTELDLDGVQEKKLQSVSYRPSTWSTTLSDGENITVGHSTAAYAQKLDDGASRVDMTTSSSKVAQALVPKKPLGSDCPVVDFPVQKPKIDRVLAEKIWRSILEEDESCDEERLTNGAWLLANADIILTLGEADLEDGWDILCKTALHRTEEQWKELWNDDCLPLYNKQRVRFWRIYESDSVTEEPRTPVNNHFHPDNESPELGSGMIRYPLLSPAIVAQSSQPTFEQPREASMELGSTQRSPEVSRRDPSREISRRQTPNYLHGENANVATGRKRKHSDLYSDEVFEPRQRQLLSEVPESPPLSVQYPVKKQRVFEKVEEKFDDADATEDFTAFSKQQRLQRETEIVKYPELPTIDITRIDRQIRSKRKASSSRHASGSGSSDPPITRTASRVRPPLLPHTNEPEDSLFVSDYSVSPAPGDPKTSSLHSDKDHGVLGSSPPFHEADTLNDRLVLEDIKSERNPSPTLPLESRTRLGSHRAQTLDSPFVPQKRTINTARFGSEKSEQSLVNSETRRWQKKPIVRDRRRNESAKELQSDASDELQDVADWIEKHKTAGQNEKILSKVLHATSMQISLSTKVLRYYLENDGKFPVTSGVWAEEDDAKLFSSSKKAKRELMEMHGGKKGLAFRKEYLERLNTR